MIRIILSVMLGLFTLLHELPAAEKAQFIAPPEIFIHHTPERSFIGPGMFAMESGDILMAAPWGRPPVHFEEVVAKFPVPMLYRSKDGGRTWTEQGRMQMEWQLPGLISDGGTSFLRLRDGRLAVVFNRHVKGLHGGGAPVIAFSGDDGNSWTAAKALIENDDAFYVMNDRFIQLSSGRLLLPVARKVGKTEGDRDEGLAMLSDDAGATWRLSRGTAGIDAPRGMAEPCVAELSDGRVLMLGRTGLGSHHVALSADSGDTWSTPEATTLESACSSLTLKTLPDGRLIVFYNHATPIKAGAFFPRTPLCYAVSEDSGKTWSPPVVVDEEGSADKDRQNIYPSVSFTAEGMVVMWSTHGADPKGSFKGQYDPNIGGGKRAVLAMPAKASSKAAATSNSVPVRLAASANPADEFPDNHHVPYEIYVREARRLVGRYVFREQDNVLAEGIDRTPIHSDSIAMTDWPVDSVACLPRTTPGSSADGILFLGEESRPAQVPYRCLLANEVKNLLVPVAISASHVGWGSVRLEPAWMQLGESAGFAAALAAKARTAPAELESDMVVRKLATSRMVVTFFNDVDVTSEDPCVPAAQYVGTKGFFADYNARMNAPLTEAVRSVWLDGFKQLQRGTLDAAKLAMAVHVAESKESPSTNELRTDVLLSLWKQLPNQP